MISRNDEIICEIKFLETRVRQSKGSARVAYKICLKRQYHSLMVNRKRIHAETVPDYELMEAQLAVSRLRNDMALNLV